MGLDTGDAARFKIELTSPRGVWIFNCAILPSRLHRTVERKGNMKPDQDLFGKVCTSLADTGVADRPRGLPL